MKKLTIVIFIIGLSFVTNAEQLRQTSVRGLLVMELSKDNFAGTASQMNATIIPKGTYKTPMRFNQKVGEMMAGSLREVEKFLSVRHHDKTLEKEIIELSFANKHNPKDGPSAAVACALLGDSILSGDKLDSRFAVTGDMTATGEVQPVGGVSAKIRGAINRGDCEIVAIPIKNQTAIEDLYISDGIEKLYKIQIFTIETFEQARKIALIERDEKTASAIEEFKLIQTALNRNKNFIKNSKVKQKLREIYDNSPNCISAKLLLLHAVGNAPKTLSPAGSLQAIEASVNLIGQSIDNGSYRNSGGDDDVLFKTLSKLQRDRSKLDKRTIPFCTAVLDVGQWIKMRRKDNIFSQGDVDKFRRLIKKLNQEKQKIESNTKFMEEIIN